ncbi:aquaporin-11 [Polypterus senegalus]
MEDLVVSIALLALTVLGSEVVRRTASRLGGSEKWGLSALLIEFASTFQLCACTHELKLLAEQGAVERPLGLTLTYAITVVHVLTFAGAFCNPVAILEQLWRKRLGWRAATARLACQFVAATGAQLLTQRAWALGLSAVHARHRAAGFLCRSSIRTSVFRGASVELVCALAMQSTLLLTQSLDGRFRVHIIAAVITFLVYAGGSLTGAIFNPVLAFSVQFPCKGHTFLENFFVYWLGPVLGMALSVLIYSTIIPRLSSALGLQKKMDKSEILKKFN